MEDDFSWLPASGHRWQPQDLAWWLCRRPSPAIHCCDQMNKKTSCKQNRVKLGVHHWWGLERLCLSWHKALQEVRWVVILVHLLWSSINFFQFFFKVFFEPNLFLVLVRRENRGRAGVRILFCIKLPICSSLFKKNCNCAYWSFPIIYDLETPTSNFNFQPECWK